jgi:8-oxo-dGTP diphosphatase
VFIATANGLPVAADDAKAAGVFSARTLPAPLAFDHAEILADYFRCREGVDRRIVFKHHLERLRL